MEKVPVKRYRLRRMREWLLRDRLRFDRDERLFPAQRRHEKSTVIGPTWRMWSANQATSTSCASAAADRATDRQPRTRCRFHLLLRGEPRA